MMAGKVTFKNEGLRKDNKKKKKELRSEIFDTKI